MPKVAIDKPIVAADEPQQSVYGALLLDSFLSEKLIASAKIQKICLCQEFVFSWHDV